jgi:hypothetical protein
MTGWRERDHPQVRWKILADSDGIRALKNIATDDYGVGPTEVVGNKVDIEFLCVSFAGYREPNRDQPVADCFESKSISSGLQSSDRECSVVRRHGLQAGVEYGDLNARQRFAADHVGDLSADLSVVS